MTIMSFLNDVQSDTHVLQTIIQEGLQKLTKILDFKDIKLPVKVRDIRKIEKKKKKIPIAISVFGFGNKEKYPVYVLKNLFKKNMFIYY